MSNIIFDACMQYENYPIKIEGEEAVSGTIYYTICSKFQKFAKNSKIVWSSKKHNPGEWYHTWSRYAISKLSD